MKSGGCSHNRWATISSMIAGLSNLGARTAVTDIAMVGRPRTKPCTAPPIVPDTITSHPRLEPRLMPDTTRSTGPVSFSRARMAQSPGVPSAAYAVTSKTPGTSSFRNWSTDTLRTATERCSVRDAPTPLCSCSGATTNSSPTLRRASAAAHRPGASMPSSFIRSIFKSLFSSACKALGYPF